MSRRENADTRIRSTSHSYFSQRLKLHYLDWGIPHAEHDTANAEPSPAPNLLLIHGMRDHSHNWDWVARALCEKFHVVAPDLRGHGDSSWALGGLYSHMDYVYDLAQLIHQEALQPVHIIAHSMGGTLACLLAGIYPEKIASLIVVEGVAGSHRFYGDQDQPQKMLRRWIDSTRDLAGRVPKKYPNLDEAFARMQKSNPHLSQQQLHHLTVHGSNRNEDGTYSWKFDNYTHARPPFPIPFEQTKKLWQSITCPCLFINGKQGFRYRIGQNDSLQYFANSQVADIDQAGHWVHHDQLETFLQTVENFYQGLNVD